MIRQMRHTFLTILFLLWISALQAQAPGYMGKKFTAGYGFYFHPSFSNAFLDYGDSPFNIQHALFAEAVTGKKFALGFSAHFYKYTYNNREHVDMQKFSDNAGNYYYQSDDHPSGQYKIRAQNFMFYGKTFKGNYLAPWGKYFQFGLVYTRYVTEYYPDEMQIKVESNNGGFFYYSDFGPPLKSYQTVDLMIGNGRSRIYGNRIVLDYGYTLQVISCLKAFGYYALEPSKGYTADKYIQTTSAKRVAAMNRFNFYVKLGYLF